MIKFLIKILCTISLDIWSAHLAYLYNDDNLKINSKYLFHIKLDVKKIGQYTIRYYKLLE